MTEPWGAIFDWDGVVIDSSRQHERSWELLAEAEGLPLPADHFKRGFGMKNEYIIPNLLHWATEPDEIARIAFKKEEFYREIIRRDGIEPLPGVREFLAALQAAGIPTCIGTSTPRLNVDTVFAVTGLKPFFQHMVSAEDVRQGKPDPDVFLQAAAKNGLPPGRCIVFEDAHVGIEAGRRAGCRVIAVASTHPASELGAAERVVRRLDELDLAELARSFPPANPPN